MKRSVQRELDGGYGSEGREWALRSGDELGLLGFARKGDDNILIAKYVVQ